MDQPVASRDERAFEDRSTSWSANLERETYATDRARLVEDALDAVAATPAGTHVNLVTHAAHGDPRAYLQSAIDDTYPESSIEYVDQCGCGGHVLRVTRSVTD